MGALLSAVTGSRFGIAGIIGVALGLVIAALWLNLHWTRSELSDALQRAGTLEAAVKIQNDAVLDLQASAAASKLAADARVLKALAPKPKPNLKTVEDLNAWLAP